MEILLLGPFVVLAITSTALLVWVLQIVQLDGQVQTSFMNRKRGSKSRSSTIMLSTIWFMFALSTAHWVVELTYLTILFIDSSVSQRAFIVDAWDLSRAIARLNVRNNFPLSGNVDVREF